MAAESHDQMEDNGQPSVGPYAMVHVILGSDSPSEARSQALRDLEEWMEEVQYEWEGGDVPVLEAFLAGALESGDPEILDSEAFGVVTSEGTDTVSAKTELGMAVHRHLLPILRGPQGQEEAGSRRLDVALDYAYYVVGGTESRPDGYVREVAEALVAGFDRSDSRVIGSNAFRTMLRSAGDRALYPSQEPVIARGRNVQAQILRGIVDPQESHLSAVSAGIRGGLETSALDYANTVMTNPQSFSEQDLQVVARTLHQGLQQGVGAVEESVAASGLSDFLRAASGARMTSFAEQDKVLARVGHLILIDTLESPLPTRGGDERIGGIINGLNKLASTFADQVDGFASEYDSALVRRVRARLRQ